MALTGLALLHLAAWLDRRDGLLARRRSIAARLAIFGSPRLFSAASPARQRGAAAAGEPGP
ncbi:MAG: hypothetical protein ACKO45_05295 [Cyanobium sp.]